jgi:hypothetical protein
MKAIRSPLGAALLAALALSLGACSDSNDPSGSTANALTQTQADDMSSDVAQDVDELAELSTFDASNGVPLAAPVQAAINGAPPAPCVTVTPNPVVNSDGDAVPDSARFIYDACVFTRGAGFVTDSLGGTIDFIDPLPLAASIGVRHIFTNFTRARVNTVVPLRSFMAVHNGLREWGGNADTLGHIITGFETAWTHPSGRTTTHEKNWVAKFTATTPGSISLITPLPAGSITVNGTGNWSTVNRTWAVQTTTVTPLQYDPTCTVAPRFTAGELTLAVSRNGEVTNVDIVFTACGQYTVTRTAAAPV